MSRRHRHAYGAAFLFGVAGLILAAGYTFWLMRPADAASDGPRALAPMEVGDAFAVRNVAAIRPGPESYAPFADEDRLWRERAVARMLRAMRTEAPAAPWKPAPEQILDDSVYALAQAARYAEAAALLRVWIAAHPTDVERVITAARLLGQTDSLDASFALYERALAARLADRALRAEYAEALLRTGRYAAAAEQFARLLAGDDGDRHARIGLARALAWSERPGEAEPLLARLWREDPRDEALLALLRSVRANLEPSAEAVRVWVESDPQFRPYRLALARAYAREGRHAEAATAFDVVLADSISVQLLSEAAGARAAASDSLGTAALLGRAVALSPADAALRERHAQALAWAGARRAAITEYSRLLEARDDAQLRLARGQLYLYVGDESSALADLERSAKLEPSYDALAAIGDLYRWRGDHRRSRAAYVRALALRPADSRILAGLSLVRAAELAAQTPRDVITEPGWNATGTYAEDNAGFMMLRAMLAYGFRAGPTTIGSFGVEQRRLSHRSAGNPERYVYGYSMGGALQHYFNRMRVGLGLGAARHALVGDMWYGHVTASAPAGPVMISMRASTGPAYTELWSFWTLAPSPAASGTRHTAMRARTMAASVTAPVGPTTVQVGAERLMLGDGNERTSYTIAVGHPISRSWRMLYAAGSLGWSDAGSAYWDPRNHVQHAIGMEYGRVVGPNMTVSARALAGVARSTERVPLAAGSAAIGGDWAPQLATGVDATYRSQAFEITAGGGYGRGAPRDVGVPGYQSLQGTLRVRITWP